MLPEGVRSCEVVHNCAFFIFVITFLSDPLHYHLPLHSIKHTSPSLPFLSTYANMTGKVGVSFCGTLTLITVIVTIIVPIVLMNQLNKVKLGSAFGKEGQQIFLADNQTITLPGTVSTTEMKVYRWDLHTNNKTDNNSQQGLSICFSGFTGQGVVAYLSDGAYPPTTLSWKDRIYATGESK